MHNCERFGQLQSVHAAETFKSSHRPDGNFTCFALVLAGRRCVHLQCHSELLIVHHHGQHGSRCACSCSKVPIGPMGCLAFVTCFVPLRYLSLPGAQCLCFQRPLDILCSPRFDLSTVGELLCNDPHRGLWHSLNLLGTAATALAAERPNGPHHRHHRRRDRRSRPRPRHSAPSSPPYAPQQSP